MQHSPQHAAAAGKHAPDAHDRPYFRLLVMAVLSFISMYLLMYAMVDSIWNIYPSLNQFYMAGLMAAPMVVIELLLMSSMYRDKKRNILILAVSVVLFSGFFVFIRQQAAVGDEDFLKSMIPHHAGAILMCQEAGLQDAETRALCEQIVAGQQAEIDQMKAILERLGE